MRTKFDTRLSHDIDQHLKGKQAMTDQIESNLERFAKIMAFERVSPLHKVAGMNQLRRIASILEKDASMNTLRAVSQEVNTMLRQASSDLEDMKRLTTFDYENPQFSEILPKRTFTEVQEVVKKSSWEDFDPSNDTDTL